MDLDGRVRSWNRGAEALFAWSAREAIGARLEELVVPDEQRAAAAQALAEAAGGALVRRAMVRRARDGERLDVEVTMRRVAPAGTPPFLAVSERRAAGPWRGLLDAAPDAMVVLDARGAIVAANAQAERLFGWSRAELLGQPIECVIPGGLGAGLAPHGVRRDGGVVAIEVSRREVDLDGETRVVAAIRDLGERTRSEAQFRDLLESAPDAMVIVDGAGRIQLVNAQTEALFGYPRGELIGQPVELLVPERARGVHPRHRAAYGARPRVRARGSGLELAGRRKDGSELPVEISLSPIRTEAGVLVSAAIRDVSERRTLQHRLQEASRLKSEFLANMSHELRTPLNAIIGFTELMLDGSVGEPVAEHREYLGDIRTSSRHLLGLINDVLDLAKVESGKMELRPARVELPRLTREVRDILRGLAASKRLVIEAEIAPAVEHIVCDPARLKQVLYNFLSNAIKFTPSGGRIAVRARPDGERDVRIEVEDSGIGIAPEQLPRLFVEFQQLDGGSAKRYPGTGLGLALSKRLAEAQGGRVEVRSEPGKGSTFAVVLPRDAAAVVVDDLAAAITPPGALPVLVVDDEPADRAWVADTLARAGYTVELAASGREAIARGAARRYAAVTLDLLLPDMHGRDVLAALRASAPNRDVPVILVTLCDPGGAPRGLPVHGALQKPFPEEALVATLRAAGVAPPDAPLPIVDDDPAAALRKATSEQLPVLVLRRTA